MSWPTPSSTYREHAPHPALARYVECYWSSRSDVASNATHRVLPDGCMDVIFSLSGDPGSRLPAGSSIAVGTMTEPLDVSRSGPMHLMGVRFSAGAGAPFIGVDASELTDRVAALSDLWNGRAALSYERLAEAKDDPARIAVLDHFLRRRLTRIGSRVDGPVLAASEAIAAEGGRQDVDEIASVAGLGRRQLERRFSAAVGISPKVACRVARLRRSVLLLSTARAHVGLSSIALEAGYADQPHFTREFRALAGTTPGAYRAARAPASLESPALSGHAAGSAP